MDKSKLTDFQRDPYELRADLRVRAYTVNVEEMVVLTRGDMGVITGMLNKTLGDDFTRKVVLGWLFDYNGSGDNPTEHLLLKSTKELSPGQWYALHEWIDAFKDDESGAWNCSGIFKDEVLSAARVAIPLYYLTNSIAYDELLDLPPFMAEIKLMGGEITDAPGKTEDHQA